MIVFVVNRIAELKAHQTTTRLIAAAAATGVRVAITDILSLAVHSPRDVRALAATVEPGACSNEQVCEVAAAPAREEVALHGASMVILRTSPGRDLELAWAHRFCLHACRIVRDTGVVVVNDPIGLERASSKLYGACLPAALTPATLVAHSWPQVRSYVENLGKPVVVKPLLGSQGRDIFFFQGPDDDNFEQTCTLLGRTGYLVVQEFLPRAVDGDIRVLLLDGDVLEVGGIPAAVRRVPRAGEFRSNVALGAQARAVDLSPTQLDVARRTAALVAEDGIRFSGLDLVGEQVVEVNVYSTGGLSDAEIFYQRDYATAVLTALASPPTGA